MAEPIYRLLPTTDTEYLGASETIWPSRTYKLDMEKGRVSGYIDGEEALKQAIWKRLFTGPENHEIYGESYGFAADDLTGLPSYIIEGEIERRIKETLLTDSRIRAVRSFQFTTEGDAVIVSFQVTAANGGEFTVEKEVAV